MGTAGPPCHGPETKGGPMDYREMTAPCGLDCFNCTVYLAGENERLRSAIAQDLGISAEQVSCLVDAGRRRGLWPSWA